MPVAAPTMTSSSPSRSPALLVLMLLLWIGLSGAALWHLRPESVSPDICRVR
ncbi:hypothetical protein X805_11060 [Sphaerotilus natans subsp. natans DSM 6575]|uniref:Uncharacterized protein n=1 Tax=Sphaerotilus natans subsp. natans DSM 6575 TaxID=1286631 RepID=A0A059KPH3_9BURK|nr:hypothetical protein X805_11060 [Sphaerotilus natans subsp. natans DSM 6575]